MTSKTEMTFPEDFLKKWLMRVNENLTREQLDEDFDSFIQDLKWQLIRNKVATENDMTVTEEELQNEAEAITRYQFQQYGYYYATDEQISGFAKQTLNNQEEAKRIAAKILDNKVLLHMNDWLRL